MQPADLFCKVCYGCHQPIGNNILLGIPSVCCLYHSLGLSVTNCCLMVHVQACPQAELVCSTLVGHTFHLIQPPSFLNCSLCSGRACTEACLKAKMTKWILHEHAVNGVQRSTYWGQTGYMGCCTSAQSNGVHRSMSWGQSGLMSCCVSMQAGMRSSD